MAFHAPVEGDAQVPSPQEVQRLTQQNPELVRQRIRQSGLSDAEIRARLQAAGLPADALDPFLDTGGPSSGASSAEVGSALASLGLATVTPDGLMNVPTVTGFQTSAGTSTGSSGGLPIFGIGQFRRATSQFQPLLSGPVPGDYRLGPGDRIVLVLTGDVQRAHEIEVTREGLILIPNVGQVSVTNLTMDGLEAVLRERLASAYSGIVRGTTTLDISVSRLRTNQIYVMGEVLQAGAYQLSSVATALNALYAAGGPTDLGSLRDVQIRRRDGETVTLDLYDYLLEGDTSGDPVLAQGDIVFVPIRGPHVSLAGAVVRPAQYEVAEGEDLVDVLRASGGFAPDALRRRITIHRVLRPAERGAGLTDRAAIDLALSASADPRAPNHLGGVAIPPVGLQNGDSIVVNSVPSLEGGYYVTVRGRVQMPGRFPWQPGMTLRDVVELARGPTVGADLREAEVSRLPDARQTGELADLLRVPMDSSYLTGAGDGAYSGPGGVSFPPAGSAPTFELQPYDQVNILLQPDFQLQREVVISGEVPVPARYSLRTKDDRVADLVGRAGGLLPTAYPEGAQLYRNGRNLGRVDIELEDALADPANPYNVVLEPGDSLHIPVYSPTVEVRGAVNSAVTVLYRPGEGLDYYLENAGGLRSDADKGRISVRYANGRAEMRDKFLFWSSYPEPGPGSVVTVPQEDPDDGIDYRGLIRDLVAVTGSLATVIIVLTR